jgi:hypothetical protein
MVFLQNASGEEVLTERVSGLRTDLEKLDPMAAFCSKAGGITRRT